MTTEFAILILLMGAAILASALIRSLFARFHVPAMVGYILLGFALRAVDSHVGLLPDQAGHVVEFLGEMGLVALLFRVGVESNVKKLLSQLGQASLIGFASIAAAGVLAFAAAFWVLHLTLFTSLIVGAAMVATSIGVPAGVWEEAGAIKSRNGQLLLDVAELDDITGVVLMALLFALVPTITQQGGQPLASILFKTVVKFVGILLLYGGACVFFAHYLEKPITYFLGRCEKPPAETLTVVAIGLIIAALAGLLGFSVAIGAFCAGLIFSRDPDSIKSRTTFAVVYDLFTPFFFLGIGLKMHLDTFGPALVPSCVLICAAFVGKFLGAAGPALLSHSWKTSVLLGLSMIPRAEIAMIISQRALALEESRLPDHVFSAIVFTCLATCLVPPAILSRLLDRWEQNAGN